MARDDYDVIVFKVLLYLYAVLKRKALFSAEDFYNKIGYEHINNDYFVDVLWMMTHDGLIEGLGFIHTWNNERRLCSELEEVRITSEGIHYLKENSRMNKIKEVLLNDIDTIATLITRCL